jgi:hypothetical protein
MYLEFGSSQHRGTRWIKVNPNLAASAFRRVLRRARDVRHVARAGTRRYDRSDSYRLRCLLPTLQLSRCLLTRSPLRGGRLAGPRHGSHQFWWPDSRRPPDIIMAVHVCQGGVLGCFVRRRVVREGNSRGTVSVGQPQELTMPYNDVSRGMLRKRQIGTGVSPIWRINQSSGLLRHAKRNAAPPRTKALKRGSAE